MTGYNFTLKENNIETEYCFEFVDIGAQYATKKQILQDSSISIKSGMYTQEKNTVNIEWTKHFGTKAADEKGQENKKVFIPFSEKIKESQALNIYDILGKLFTAKKYILDSVSSAKPTDLLYFCLKSKYLSFPFIYFSPSEEMDLFEPENSISPVFLSKEIEFFGQDAMPDIINKIAKVAQMKFFSIGSFYTSYNYKVFLMAFLSKFAEADIANYHIAAFVISPVNELKSAFYLFIGDENNMNDVKLIDENGNFIYTDKFEKFQVNVKLNASGSAETFGNYKEIE